MFLVIALIPGAIAWWSSRGLEKLKDDPALPELLFARRARLSSATWFAIIATAFADDQALRFGLFALSVASPFIGSYPLSRKLFGHTIGFFGYLWQGLKALVATAGGLITLIYIPAIVTAVPEPWRPATLLLIPLLIAWSWWFVEFWLALNEARPLNIPAVNVEIDAVASRASVIPPPLYLYGAERMKVMNAVALRGPRPAIALGNGLVESMTPKEVAAVYAHEIAHIEQVSPRELRRSRLITWTQVVVGVVGFYFAAERLPAGLVDLASSGWALLIIVMLGWQQKRGKRQETESDLRAAELTGEPEVVASALVKIHVLGLVPRRWSSAFEKSASHPSLARRIQALRGTAPAAAAAAAGGQPTIIQTARPSRVIAFDATKAYWFEGVPADTQRDLNALREHASGMRAASWNDLVELRIAADSEEDRALVATHKNGETWTVPIAKSDVAAVQKLLDRVDTQLHGGIRKTASRISPRAMLALAAVVMLVTSPGLLLFPVIVGVLSPSTAMLAGVAGLTAVDALLGLRQFSALFGYWSVIPRVLSLIVAVSLVMSARRRARNEKRDGLQFTVILLALCGLVPMLVAGASLSEGLAALQGDPSLRGFAPCLAGIGAAHLIAGRRQARAGGALSLTAAGAVAAFAFVGPVALGDSFSTESAQLHETRRLDFPAQGAASLEASPGGRGFLVHAIGPEDDRRGQWQLRYDDSLWIMPVIGAGFVDSTHVISLWSAGDSLELRMERLDTSAVEWVMPLPSLRRPRLTTRPGSRSWAVVGQAPASDSIVVVSGAIGQDESPISTLPPIDSMVPGVFIPAPDGRSIVGLRMGLEAADKASLIESLVLRRGFTSELWESSAKGIRRLGDIDGVPSCGGSGPSAIRCMTFGANGVTFWRFAGDSLEKEAAVGGRQFFRTDMGASGLVTMLDLDGSEVQFGDPVTRSLVKAKVPITESDGYVNTATSSADRVWVAVKLPSKLSVIEYRVTRDSHP
jgi:Zn-dependent protease with chaperone function